MTINSTEPSKYQINYKRSIPFLLVHLSAFSVFLVGFSKTALVTCFIMYVARMFGITGGYHRYFSHRSYKTSRFFQFILALLGNSAAQNGPLWWAAHHRHHHKYSDTEEDTHSPIMHSLFWGHVGWIFHDKNRPTNFHAVRDLAKYPELRFLDRYDLIAPVTLAVAIFFSGVLCQNYFPELQTNGWQMLAWGFFLSTILTYHGTFTINSLSHLIGKRRFETTDHSRNNFVLAIITLGEGWHNNHHYYQASEKQGMFWWEIDVSHYILKTLSWFGLVWDLKTYPKHIVDKGKQAKLQLANAHVHSNAHQEQDLSDILEEKLSPLLEPVRRTESS